MNLRKYTEEQLTEAVRTSFSYRQVLQKLNVAAYGGNYTVLKKAINHFGLDTTHFRGQGWNKGQTFGPKRPIDDYLSNKHPLQSYKLKNRLIEEEIFQPVCSNCGLDTWLGEQIPLELDHIDGNNKNNNLSNLRVLCPNCHALTPTYRGKNMLKA